MDWACLIIGMLVLERQDVQHAEFRCQVATRKRSASQDGSYGPNADATLATSREHIAGKYFKQLAEFRVTQEAKVLLPNCFKVVAVCHGFIPKPKRRAPGPNSKYE